MSDRQGTDLPPGHPLLEGLSGLLSMSSANLALGGSWVDLVMDAYFELLLGADDTGTRRLVAQHADAGRVIQPRIASLSDELRNLPQPFDPDVVMKSRSWQRLESEVAEVIGAYSPNSARIIQQGTASAVHLANEAADQAWTAMALDLNDPAIARRWAKVPDRAFADMVGPLQDGSPLSDLLDTMPDATNKEMRRGLLRGIALGENSDVIAARVSKATGLPLHRSVAISRTTIHNTYRETSRRSYQMHPDIVDGWFWQSAQDSRSCMACIARDGTLYPLSEPMPAHANCRCRMRPHFRNGENNVRQTGREWFDQQSDATKFQMLGPSAHDAFKQGKFDIADLAGFVIDPRWGASSSRRSLDDAISFARNGRPFDPRDFPPGWATPLDPAILEEGLESALAQLDEVKALWASTPTRPAGIDDFAMCMGH